MSDKIINCGNNVNDDTNVHTSDKVTFHNSLNNKSIALVLPANQGGNSCFSGDPTSPVNIAAGQSSSQYNISGTAHGTHHRRLAGSLCRSPLCPLITGRNSIFRETSATSMQPT